MQVRGLRILVAEEDVKELGLITCGRSVFREQNSSFGGVAVVHCLGVVHMEEEVQDRVQVEVGEQGEGQTHGKEQGQEQRETRRSINRSP